MDAFETVFEIYDPHLEVFKALVFVGVLVLSVNTLIVIGWVRSGKLRALFTDYFNSRPIPLDRAFDSAYWKRQAYIPHNVFTRVTLMIFVSAVWIMMLRMNFLNDVRPHHSRYERYQQGVYQVAEGCVRVIERQPRGGHGPSDIVIVGDTAFEISYFSGDAGGYNRSLAYGGVLDEGRYARVRYIQENGSILRRDRVIVGIDIRATGC